MLTSDAYSGWHALTATEFLITLRASPAGLEQALLGTGRHDERYPDMMRRDLGETPSYRAVRVAKLLGIPAHAVTYTPRTMTAFAHVEFVRPNGSYDRKPGVWRSQVPITIERFTKDPDGVRRLWHDNLVLARRESIENAWNIDPGYRPAHNRAMHEQRLERCAHGIYYADDGYHRYLPCPVPRCHDL